MSRFANLMATVQQPFAVYFVRHGESEGNVRGIMQGRGDHPLSEAGRDQARRLGKWFREAAVNPVGVLASPLSRAAESASIIASEAGWPAPETCQDAVEIDTGVFSDLTLSEVEQRYPDHFARFSVDSWEVVPEAEKIASLMQRALAVWNRVVNQVRSTTEQARPSEVVVVAHGGIIQWILKTSFGADTESPSAWMPLIPAANCGVFVYNMRPVRATVDQSLAEGYYGQWTVVNGGVGTPVETVARARTKLGGLISAR